ncbi:MAG: Protein-disulfide isomerase [Candidatus Collierbacteria bacterium GW2011_GWA2_46_26]|uniref:Protein-disulfide isomerase n=1 Tax=Candidatus Collierbacteria bacterium GW2011_GWA2_46_26 TaxID=1618381 RepID=A0A0G1PI31_9BACT|nr:MAG: Protein-disulfide isomerase [Candidatus Collierbacteria bacterium GW2011_GWA2_46_26]
MSVEKIKKVISSPNQKHNSYAPALVVLLIVAAFFLGSLWTEVKYLKNGVGQPVLGAGSRNTPPAQQAPEDSGAPVYPQIKKDYIDTGKVKMVFRDLPLGFHQNAPKEAEAAECARKQGGDTAYFKYHDQIFTKTTSNGTGLALDQLPVIAKELGLNVSKFQQCLDSGEFKTEVDKDLADAAKVGASGTPTFFIGKSTSNGEIDGIKIVGAQPYSVFKAIIDELLK